MSLPMDPTTPTSANKSKCRSTHSLVPSPVRNRRELTFGSASRDGYGIVSAAGLNAWRRGAKRNRTPSVSAGVSGSGRLGLGMGLEGTPGRKKFKRFSKSSKPSIGFQSTPKTAQSRSTLRTQVEPNDRTALSELSSNLPSSVVSASEPSETTDEATDSFALGASPIVGEDVFGHTIGIDASGRYTVVYESPASSIWGWDESYDYGTGQYDRFVWDAGETPGKSSESEDVPKEVLEADNLHDDHLDQYHLVSLTHDQTIFWDESVPIHGSTDPVQQDSHDGYDADEFTYDAGFMTMLENPTYLEETVPLNDTSFTPSRRRQTSELSMIRRQSSKDKISNRPKTPRRPTSTVLSTPYKTLDPSDMEQSIEMGRGLNISKLGLPAMEHQHTEEGDAEPSSPSLPRSPSSLIHSDPPEKDTPKIIDSLSFGNSESDVDHAGRISLIIKDGMLNEEPQWDVSYPRFSPLSPSDDLFGFKTAEKLIKGEKPRRYRATSELETPPISPSRSPPSLSSLSSRSYASSSSMQIVTPKPNSTNSGVEKVEPAQRIGKGLWKGGPRRTRKSSTRREEDTGLGDTSHDTSIDGITKRFIEPEYDERASRARDARIAHYEELAQSFALHVEGGYF